MQSKVSYKCLSQVDSDVILSLEKASFETHSAWNLRMIEESVQTSSTKFFCACFEQQPIGYCVISDLDGEYELLRICVSKEYRRLGVAYGLIKFILNFINQNLSAGVCEPFMMLEVSETNYSAQKLYEKCGFKPIATRKNYYFEAGEYKDAIIMKLFL